MRNPHPTFLFCGAARAGKRRAAHPPPPRHRSSHGHDHAHAHGQQQRRQVGAGYWGNGGARERSNGQHTQPTSSQPTATVLPVQADQDATMKAADQDDAPPSSCANEYTETDSSEFDTSPRAPNTTRTPSSPRQSAWLPHMDKEKIPATMQDGKWRRTTAAHRPRHPHSSSPW